MEEMEKNLEQECPVEAETTVAQEPEEQATAAPEVQEAEAPAAPAAEKKPMKKPLILGASAVALIAAIVLFVVYALPAIKYSGAVKAYDNGEYAQAVEAFTALEDYKESADYLAQAQLGVHYVEAGSKVQAGEYAEAIAEYKQAKDFQDTKELLKQTYVLYGDSLLEQKKYDDAIKEYRNASASAKITEAYGLKGEALFAEKKFVEAAEAFASANDQGRRLDCGIALVEVANDYAAAVTILESDESEKAVSYLNYANGSLSMEAKEYQAAMDHFAACAKLLDADVLKEEAMFLLAEKCLYDGYLNKAKRLYTELPEGYAQGDVVVADRIKLLNDNAKLLALVGNWSATDTYYKVQADSTTSSYYYYWYQDGLRLGTVTVTCPYNGDGTFTIKGTATFPSYQNFSSSASKLKTDMETFYFSVKASKTIPYQIDSSSTTKLTFNGKQFDLQYKYVNNSSNVYWHYTFTSKASYGSHYMLAEDK